MRSTIIPAQITTIEDKIAGNLNFTQILLLMIPVFTSLVLYAFIAPQLELTPAKIGLSIIVFGLSIILSMRYRGKVLLDWLIIYSRYSLRPGYYLFDKNDRYLRDIYLPEVKLPPKPLEAVNQPKQTTHPTYTMNQVVYFDDLLSHHQLNIALNQRKGGFDVAYQQVDR